jgi:hypothetical protein
MPAQMLHRHAAQSSIIMLGAPRRHAAPAQQHRSAARHTHAPALWHPGCNPAPIIRQPAKFTCVS